MRVLWRFRLLVAVGILLGALAGIFSVARVDLGGGTPTLVYREQEEWISASTIFVTQEGFPWGRAVLDEMIQVETPGGTPTFVPRFGEPGRYSGLAALYAELAKSDAVRRQVLAGAPDQTRYEPQVVQSPESGSALPLIYMAGYGPTPEAAVDVANRATDSFRRYLASEQARSEIEADKRVEVVVTRRAAQAEISERRSFARPIFLFVLVAMVFVAVSFALESFRPRPRPRAEVVSAEYPAPVRRSA